MWLETVTRLQPDRREVDHLVVRDANGTPVAVFVQHGSDILFSTVWGDNDFEETLHRFGVKEHVELRVYEPKGLAGA